MDKRFSGRQVLCPPGRSSRRGSLRTLVAVGAAMAVTATLFVTGLAAAPAAAHDGHESSTSHGGPVIIDGTDAGLHGSVVLDGTGVPKEDELKSTWYYELKAWETLLANVSTSYAHNGKVALVGSTHSTATRNDCGAAAHYVSERVASGAVDVDYYSGTTAISDFFDGVLAGTHQYAMIQIAEANWCGNGMDSAEDAEVATNAAAIAAHVNRGGALFSQSQSYAWLSALFPTLSASTNCWGSTPALTAAGYGQFPGLSDSHIAAPWHNCFVDSSGTFPLTQLALQDNTHTVILGGTSVSFPSNIDLAVAPSQPRPGQEVCTTATVTGGGAAVEGATVDFTVDGPSGAPSAAVATDATGVAVYCYTSAGTGLESVTALVSEGPGIGSVTSAYTWSKVSLAASPTSVTRGDQVCVTATAGDFDGTAVVPIEGATVTFSVSGVNSPADATAVTDAAGNADYCYTGPNGGDDTVAASIGTGDALDSRSIGVFWSGPRLAVPDLNHPAGESGKVVPVSIEEFTGVTNMTARLVLGDGGGTLALDTTGLTITDNGTGGLTATTDLHFSGTIADVTTALGSRITWSAPAAGQDVTLTVTAQDSADATVSATGTAVLAATAAPAMSTQPSELAVVVDAGTDVDLSAAATGWPAPTVLWQVSADDGATWTTIDGATSGTHTFTTTRDMNGNRYRARFSNVAGFTVSDVVVLTANAKTQTIAFPELATTALNQSPPALAATSEAGSGIVYAAAPAEVCTVTDSTLTLVAQGTCTVTASHDGGDVYAPAVPVERSFTVGPALTNEPTPTPTPTVRVTVDPVPTDDTGSVEVPVPGTDIVVRFTGGESTGGEPALVVTPVAGDGVLQDRGVTAVTQRYDITVEQMTFDTVEVCLPFDTAAFARHNRPADRLRLLHIHDGVEEDITAQIEWDTDPALVCGQTDRFSEFQVAVYAGDRIGGSDRYATAAGVARHLHPAGADTVYVATGENHPDALAAGVAAAQVDAPVLLVQHGTVPAATADVLAELSPTSIVVVGGDSAVADIVVEQLAELTGAAVRRVAGVDRYETAALVALERFPNGADTVYLATGTTFPDALTGGSMAAQQNAAVLLTAPDGLPSVVVDALGALDPATTIVVGGESAVSENVFAALASIVGGDVTRVAGDDRYGTAAALAEGHSGGTAIAATGRAYADALVAATLAMAEAAPVVLVDGDAVPGATSDRIAHQAPDHLFVVGGQEAVGPQAELTLTRLLPLYSPERL